MKSLESEPTFQGLSKKLRQIYTFHLGCISFVLVEENAFVHNSGVSRVPIGMKNKYFLEILSFGGAITFQNFSLT